MPRLTRRKVCLSAVGASISRCIVSFAGANAGAALAQGASSPRDARLKDRDPADWIAQWQAESVTNKALEGPLSVQRFQDPMYILLSSIAWKPNLSTSNLRSVEVPKGFVTDFASVPRVFWSLFRPDGNYAYAAALHDWLYWEQDQSKLDADSIFRAAMDDLKITDWQAVTLYHAVDVFGGAAWKQNADLKSRGERRVLVEFPHDPAITWAEWKSRPGVFGN